MSRTGGMLSRLLPGTRVDEAELVAALGAHAGLMLRAASEVLGTMAEAEDVCQDVAERLLRRRPTEVRSWPGLLKTMAVNASIDRLRRRRDPGELPEPDRPAEPDSIELARQQAAALRRAVGRLSERDARLFGLHFHAGLDHAAIGDALSMTPNAVGVALHRLRARLTTELTLQLQEEQ
ncbi:MAG: sigma-70 family RNA polymerase sigma factor [Pseudomonadota bacterium]